MDEPARPVTRSAPARTRRRSPAPAVRTARRPGPAWYALTLLILFAGMAWPLLGVRATDMRIAAFQRVPAAAGGDIALPRSGRYLVYYERAGTGQPPLPGFGIRARPVSPALTVRVTGPPGLNWYDSSGSEGAAVAVLTVTGPGTITLSAPGAPPGGQLAVGARLPSRLLVILPGIGLMLAGVAGIVLLAGLASRRGIRRVRYPGRTP
jgi:hypothetical protein